MNNRRLLAFVTMFGMVASGCSSPEPSSQASVDLREFAINVSASRWEAGSIVLDVENTGEYAHAVVLTDGSGDVVAATGLLRAGGDVAMEVDLGPGNYQLTCRIVAQSADGALVDHFESGMIADVIVEA